MRRIGEAVEPWLAHLRERAAAGKLGDNEAAAQYAREREEAARRQRDLFRERQCSRLSRRHVRDARRIASGETPAGEAWKRLLGVTRDMPDASILIAGYTGIGKTTAATAWAVRRIHEGYTAMGLACSRARGIASDLEAMWEAEMVDVLILDQMHRLATLPDWIATAVLGLIDYRYEQQRQTIGVATVAPDRVEDILGAEVVDRFQEQIILTDSQSKRR